MHAYIYKNILLNHPICLLWSATTMLYSTESNCIQSDYAPPRHATPRLSIHCQFNYLRILLYWWTKCHCSCWASLHLLRWRRCASTSRKTIHNINEQLKSTYNLGGDPQYLHQHERPWANARGVVLHVTQQMREPPTIEVTDNKSLNLYIARLICSPQYKSLKDARLALCACCETTWWNRLLPWSEQVDLTKWKGHQGSPLTPPFHSIRFDPSRHACMHDRPLVHYLHVHAWRSDRLGPTPPTNSTGLSKQDSFTLAKCHGWEQKSSV